MMPGTGTHECPRRGCTRRVFPQDLACPAHWRLVSPATRGEVCAAYRSGDAVRHAVTVDAAIAEMNRPAGAARWWRCETCGAMLPPPVTRWCASCCFQAALFPEPFRAGHAEFVRGALMRTDDGGRAPDDLESEWIGDDNAYAARLLADGPESEGIGDDDAFAARLLSGLAARPILRAQTDSLIHRRGW